jgi:hypothetical protein
VCQPAIWIDWLFADGVVNFAPEEGRSGAEVATHGGAGAEVAAPTAGEAARAVGSRQLQRAATCASASLERAWVRAAAVAALMRADRMSAAHALHSRWARSKA